MGTAVKITKGATARSGRFGVAGPLAQPVAERPRRVVPGRLTPTAADAGRAGGRGRPSPSGATGTATAQLVEPERDDHDQGLHDDPARHLRLAHPPVPEDDRDLDDPRLRARLAR